MSESISKSDVAGLIQAQIQLNNDQLLASTQTMMDRSVTQLKRSSSETARIYKSELRAKAQKKQALAKNPKRYQKRQSEDSNSKHPIPVVANRQSSYNAGVKPSIKPGNCFSCGKEKVIGGLVVLGCRLRTDYMKSCHRLVNEDRHISYSTFREKFKADLTGIVEDPSIFSTHSLRSGGATLAANSGINDRIIQRHGRWKSASSKDMYIEDEISKKLEVSKHLQSG